MTVYVRIRAPDFGHLEAWEQNPAPRALLKSSRICGHPHPIKPYPEHCRKEASRKEPACRNSRKWEPQHKTLKIEVVACLPNPALRIPTLQVINPTKEPTTTDRDPQTDDSS